MKKLLTLLTLILAILTLTSACGNSREAKVALLKHQIAEENKQYPKAINEYMLIESVTYDDDNQCVAISFLVNPDVVDIKQLKTNREIYKVSMLNSMLANKESEQLYKTISEAGAGIRMVLKANDTSDEVALTIDNDELTELVNNPHDAQETGSQLLTLQVEMEKQRCPYPVDEGMILTDVRIEGDEMIYEAELDEDIYDVEWMKQNTSMLKANMNDIFNDPIIAQQAQLLSSQNKALTYLYRGNHSGTEYRITFSVEELRKVN